jgi:hypothetical protein
VSLGTADVQTSGFNRRIWIKFFQNKMISENQLNLRYPWSIFMECSFHKPKLWFLQSATLNKESAFTLSMFFLLFHLFQAKASLTGNS